MENKLENPYFSIRLFGLNNYLGDLINTFENKIFPSTSLIIGKKGIGKFTLINHFLNYIFDKSYDREKCMINLNSDFSKKYLGGTFPNIIYLGENNAITPKIDDIRNIQNILMKSSFEKNPRFIILDNLDLLNINSLNALLKTLENPGQNNHFILIQSSEKPLLETILSRSLLTRIHINKMKSNNIIKNLIDEYKIENILDIEKIQTTPGNFLKFNSICIKNSINIEEDFIDNLKHLFLLFKKSKDKNFITFASFLSEKYFNELQLKNPKKILEINEFKIKTLKMINDFVEYNLNQQTVINKISNNLNNAA